MKKFVFAVLFGVGALVAYNYATTGTVALVPAAKSEQTRTVEQFADRFHDARQQLSQAQRTAGLAGIDTTADAEGARVEVTKLQRELSSLRKRLDDDRAIEMAEQLAREMERFVRTL